MYYLLVLKIRRQKFDFQSIKNYILQLLIGLANTQPIKPFKPRIRNLAIKLKLFSFPVSNFTSEHDGEEFESIILLENIISQEFEPNKRSAHDAISTDLERHIKNIVNKGPSVVVFAHDNFTKNIGGIQTVMHLENKAISEVSGNYWSIHPTKSREFFVFAPELELLHNGKFIAHIQTENVGKLLKILEEIVLGKSEQFLVVLHSLLGHDPEKVSSALQTLKTRNVYFYLHDFYSICPSFKLLRNNLEFCHAPKVTSTSCKVCIYGNTRTIHINRIESILTLPEITFLAPSQSTRDIWTASSEITGKAVIAPHLRLTSLAARGGKVNPRPRIAFFGLPRKEKGWNSFLSLFAMLNKTHDFVVFSTQDPGISGVTFNLLKNDSGEIHQTRDILIENRIDYAFIFPTWPETYSLVTAEAIAAGVFVLTNSHSGNVASLIEEFNSGAVFESLDLVVDFLTLNVETNLNLQIYDVEFVGIVSQFVKVEIHG